jgi:RNA polymerase sigma factor (sigma-70 family)
VLARLLAASDVAEQDAAWADFVADHTGLLLHACHALSRERDAVMNGYAFILDALREDDCRRLRAYVPAPGTQFTTWLVVVARRLLLDHHRQRYGRPRSQDETHRAEHAARRRLEDLVAAELDPEELRSAAESPDAGVMRHELTTALRSVLAALDPPDRLLLALRFEDERPMREIAAALGMPTVFHAYRRLAAILATLKRSLARHGVEAPEP